MSGFTPLAAGPDVVPAAGVVDPTLAVGEVGLGVDDVVVVVGAAAGEEGLVATPGAGTKLGGRVGSPMDWNRSGAVVRSLSIPC